VARALLLLFALAGIAAPGRTRPAGDPAPDWGVASSLTKLRPQDLLPAGREIALSAARGECEAAQVAVRSPRGLSALRAEAAPLAPGGVPVVLYRVATLDLARPSGPDGAAGTWPDPLVPVRDPDFGEARRAFPVAVPAGALQSIWVEICIPDDLTVEARRPRAARAGPAAPPTRAGPEADVLRGAVRVLDGDRLVASVPLTVHLWPFTLPRTPTFVAAFGLSTRLGTRALGHPDDPALARALVAAALRHRLSPFTLSADPPGGRCTAAACNLDWSALDAELSPLLDGTLVPGVKGGFAEVRIPGAVWSGPEEDLTATLRAWREHFAHRGWLERLWLYTLDEPGPAELGELARRARLARTAGLRVFATTLPQPVLAGLVDAFAPNLTLLPGGRAAPGVRFSYASCLSHGCGELPSPEDAPRRATRAAMVRAFQGWPGYEIDRPATAARAVAWLAWRRGLAGELYYDMLQAWTRDPWTDVRAFAGNGDGTLLYPGRPEALGGVHPFPVGSLRLAVIRDGLEDLELLRLAEAAGLGPLAETLAARLVPSPRTWERRPEPWLEARRTLGNALARRLAGRPP